MHPCTPECSDTQMHRLHTCRQCKCVLSRAEASIICSCERSHSGESTAIISICCSSMAALIDAGLHVAYLVIMHRQYMPALSMYSCAATSCTKAGLPRSAFRLSISLLASATATATASLQRKKSREEGQERCVDVKGKTSLLSMLHL